MGKIHDMYEGNLVDLDQLFGLHWLACRSFVLASQKKKKKIYINLYIFHDSWLIFLNRLLLMAIYQEQAEKERETAKGAAVCLFD
jgi:hypothetical protein